MIINSYSKFMKVEEAKSGDVVTVLNAGEIRDNERFKHKLPDGTEIPKKDYIFKVKHQGTEKQLTMNKMSRDNMAKAFTSDTKEWVGKEATVELCLFSNGKKGIVLTPIINSDADDDTPDFAKDEK